MTATSIESPEWVRATLVTASLINVPLFLLALFLLQTKFRPEMQEDSYYAMYLESNTGKLVFEKSLTEQLQTELSKSNTRYIELESELRSKLEIIATQIEVISTRTEEADLRVELNALAQNVGTSLPSHKNQPQKLPSGFTQIQINDLLPGYFEIRNKIEKHHFPISGTFGSSSEEPEVPKYKVISFGISVPIADLRIIVGIAQDFGFDQISYTDSSPRVI